MDLISVIIPIYKVEKYLNRCIESVVQQTYKNLEIILVDDGSPDQCPRICDEWKKKDERIRVIHKHNGGLSDARNAGLEIATGTLIGFVDSDDWISPSFYEKLYKNMMRENADIVECGVSYVDEKGTTLRVRKCISPQVSLDKINALRQLVLEEDVYQTVWNKLYRKNVIGDIKFKVGKCNEDDFWTYRVIDKAEKVLAIKEPLYYYLQRDTSIMGVDYSIKRIDSLEARFERMEFLQKYDDLAMFSKARLMYDCLFHFQAAIKFLEPTEQKFVTDYVIEGMKKIPSVQKWKSQISFKYKIWFVLFKRFPFIIANLRNRMRIGL